MTNRLNLLRGEMRTVEMAHEKASAELEDSLRQLTHSEKLRIERLEAANTEYRHLEAYVKSTHKEYMGFGRGWDRYIDNHLGITASGASLDRVADDDIQQVKIPNGVPLLYRLDAAGRELRALIADDMQNNRGAEAVIWVPVRPHHAGGIPLCDQSSVRSDKLRTAAWSIGGWAGAVICSFKLARRD